MHNFYFFRIFRFCHTSRLLCLFSYFALLAMLQNCFALQSITIGDNQTKNVTISANELSRIFVKGDRVLNVRGVEGAYILTKDAVQGQIFIKPTALDCNSVVLLPAFIAE